MSVHFATHCSPRRRSWLSILTLARLFLGAARAPTGEVHIRGQHGEYSYYVDGVPVPSGISGSLNELFDPANVSAGYSFIVGEAVVRPELFLDNAFNKQYLLKGAFLSGASVGRPRSVQLRVNVGV